jgi:hypothetical protein
MSSDRQTFRVDGLRIAVLDKSTTFATLHHCRVYLGRRKVWEGFPVYLQYEEVMGIPCAAESAKRAALAARGITP